MLHFEIVRTESVGKWHARIRGDNEKIIFATQLYPSRESAVKAIKDVQRNAEDAITKPDIVKPDEDQETRRLRKKMKP